MTPAPFIGIIIGALAGGAFFIFFGLIRAAHRGGFSIVLLLNKLIGEPVTPTPLIRLLIAAGILLSIVLGVVVSLLLGGAIGWVIEYLIVKIT